MNLSLQSWVSFLLMLILPGLVFMGMGDAADNPDEVKQALKILTDVDLFHMGQTKVIVPSSSW